MKDPHSFFFVVSWRLAYNDVGHYCHQLAWSVDQMSLTYRGGPWPHAGLLLFQRLNGMPIYTNLPVCRHSPLKFFPPTDLIPLCVSTLFTALSKCISSLF
ncbi:hypothetical protein CHARACLAT_013871 [Characodon lateralis]|uniref:Uncharacterized protein n=1 Tax=Characodon lateralis TaxID=208331 RepID=A0ABU7CR64_9TELE|nr:hypothetical protein [Characodon lateralis]